MPTTFTPPASCLHNLYLPGSNAPLLVTPFLKSGSTSTPSTMPIPSLGWSTQAECYPADYQAMRTRFTLEHSPTKVSFGGYCSPGACASGYTSACKVDDWWTTAGEEIALCCPRYLPCRLVLLLPLLTVYLLQRLPVPGLQRPLRQRVKSGPDSDFRFAAVRQEQSMENATHLSN